MTLLELVQLIEELKNLQKPKAPKVMGGMSMEQVTAMERDYNVALDAYQKRKIILENLEIK
jgi:hypothetical protein